jgi:hypothetical protein
MALLFDASQVLGPTAVVLMSSKEDELLLSAQG